MALNLETQFVTHSARVKCVDIHSEKNLLLVSLHTGEIQVWNYATKSLVKAIKICKRAVRAAKFISRENWIVSGSDEGEIYVFDAETFDQLHLFKAHTDFVRSLAVHPTLPYLISASDDKKVNVWDWSNQWRLEQMYEGHGHYVMQVVINPRDTDTFATASLDKTIKLWILGAEGDLMTLEGHLKGVNCVDFHGDSQLISGSDDNSVKVWDLKNKTCLKTLDGHNLNVTSVRSLNSKIFSGSEDSSVRIWNATSESFCLEKTLNYEMGRAWAIEARDDVVAIGWDSGAVALKL